MIELVLLVCLAAEPDKCHQEYPAFQSLNGLHACMIQGQFIAAKWEADHPKYRVRKWVCGPPRT